MFLIALGGFGLGINSDYTHLLVIARNTLARNTETKIDQMLPHTAYSVIGSFKVLSVNSLFDAQLIIP